MGVRYRDTGFDRAQARLEREGLEVMRESADACRDTAQELAPVDTGELESKIIMIPNSDGAVVASLAKHNIWLEFGTGIYAEGGDGRKTPWSYVHPRWGWVTTRGGKAQPHMRPGFDAGVGQFAVSKRRRGL